VKIGPLNPEIALLKKSFKI